MSSKLRNIIFAAIGAVVILGTVLFITPLGDKLGLKLSGFSSMIDFSKSETGVYYPKVKILSNGLEVIVVENDRAPIVNHMLWMSVGSADEEQGKTGLAHFLEHLVFGPTKNKKKGWYEDFITSIGGQFNALTYYDFTAYFMNTSKEHLESVMQAEAERMQNLVFDQTFFDSEKLVVLEEERSRYANNPSQNFNMQLARFLFHSHPYTRYSIGHKKDIDSLTLSDAKEFYEKWYAPNNAHLVVTGDVNAEEVFAMAEEVYGGWSYREVPKRNRSMPENPISTAHIVYEDPYQSKDTVKFAFLVPSERQEPEEALILEMISDMISEKSSSIYQDFIVKKASITDLRATYESYRRDTVGFILSFDLANGHEIDEVQKDFYLAFQSYAKAGIDQQTFDLAKKRYIDSALFVRDSLMGAGYAFGVARTTGVSVEQIEDWNQRINNITLDAVNKVLQTYFVGTHYVFGYLRPQKQENLN